jgi:hypothetical protein
MRDIRQYWRDVRAVEETLPEFVWLVSAASNSSGFVTEVPAAIAARLLKAKSHRMATDEEVAAYHASAAKAMKQARSERMRRSGAAIVVVEETAKSEPFPRRQR